MDKKVYNIPVMVAETFTPNNYVSTCDLWRADATNLTSSTYYHDVTNTGVVDLPGDAQQVNNPIPFYFKLSENSGNISQNSAGEPSSLTNNVNNDNLWYDGYATWGNGKRGWDHGSEHHGYSTYIFKVVGYPNKESSSSGTYYYTSPGNNSGNFMSFTKAAS